MDRVAHNFDGDVIVVGAGPVGMTAAILLSRLGLSVLVFEGQALPSSAPKAISLDDESLRVYQAAGIVDRVLSIVVPGTGTMYYAKDGTELFHAKGPEAYRLGHPFKNPFAQPDLERVLRDVIQERSSVALSYGSRVTEVEQDDHGVRVSVESDTGLRSFRARYLIGADGGRSTVRDLLGITMTGRSHPETWLVVDTLEDDHDERFGMHHGQPARPHVIVPGLNGRCRYEFLLFEGEGEPGEAPAFELMRSLVSPYRALSPEQVERAVNYRFNGLNADSWYEGRSFLAGDAAHMMPPFAGQGLNSGIRDVGNLSWKLSSVVDGILAESALESYEVERRPHAEATIQLSERLGRVVMTTSQRLAAWRDATVRRAMATASGRDYFEQMRYRPAARFKRGLVVDPARHERVGLTIAQPRVFDTITHRVRMLDDVIGVGWAIVGVDVTDDDWHRVKDLESLARAVRLHVPTADVLPRLGAAPRVIVDIDGGLNREFSDLAGSFVLVRPDRVVAAVWRPAETQVLVTHARTWFAPSDPSSSLQTTNAAPRSAESRNER